MLYKKIIKKLFHDFKLQKTCFFLPFSGMFESSPLPGTSCDFWCLTRLRASCRIALSDRLAASYGGDLLDETRNAQGIEPEKKVISDTPDKPLLPN